MAERTAAGFTLLEVLVALVIFALAALALLALLADAAARDDRLRSAWRLAQAADLVWQSLRLGETPPVSLLPPELAVRLRREPLDRDLARVVVEVQGRDGRSFRLVGLLPVR